MAKDRLFFLLIVAFAAVSMGFLGATLYSEVQATAIDRETSQLETNSLPSVEHLAAARGALRHLDVSAEEYADDIAAQRAESIHVLEESRSELAKEVGGVDETADYPGESELRDEGARHGQALADSVDRLLRASGPDMRADYEEVHRHIDAIDDVLSRRTEMNASHAHDELAAVSAVRRQSIRLAIGLNAACLLLTIGATLVALRAVRRQREIEQAHERVLVERAEELDMFAKRVAHDLLNPLSALSFTLSSIKRNTERKEPVASQLVRADACLKRAQRLVDGALDFARSGVQPAGTAKADVREAVSGVVDEARADEEGGAEIVVEPFEDVEVACAPGVLASVLANLVRNALKYMAGRELRRVTIRVLARGEAESEGALVRVEVEDTGPGLPPGWDERVWGAYVRAPDSGQPGLGLGLATVRRFVDSHGGHVGVTPAPMQGSVFWFELPRATGARVTAM